MRTPNPAGYIIAIIAMMWGSGSARAEQSAPAKLTAAVDACEVESGLSDEQRIERAADHYDRGAVLYEQGDYARAVEEFVVAYCDKPHSSMFYNIGQSYERMLDFERAVAYFQRFLDESEQGSSNRRRAEVRIDALSRLPARLRIATVPPGANVTLQGTAAVAARGISNADDPILVRQGTYKMNVELPGYESVVETVEPKIGQPYSFYFRLEPNKGTVRIVASPRDSRIFLNDRLVGLGSYVETIPIGTYRVVFEAKDRPSEERTIEVKADKTTELSVRLAEPPKSGRWQLVTSSGLGLGIMSVGMFTTLFDQSDTVSGVGGLVGLGIGFGGAYFGVPENISVGKSSYFITSTLIGALEGALIAAYFSCNNTVNEPSNCNQATIGGTTIVSSLAGLLFAAVTVNRFDLDAGDAALLNSGALWGTTSGLLFFAVFDEDARIQQPLIFGGLNLGLIAGATLAARTDVSRARVALIDLSGLAGTIAGFGIAAAIDNDSPEQYAHFTLLGLATGLITGALLTRNMDERTPSIGTLRPSVRSAIDSAGMPTTTFGAELSF